MDKPLSNTDFAEQLGIDVTSASRLRNGTRKPGGDLLAKIIDTFGLPAHEALAAYRSGAGAFGRYLDERVFGRTPDQAKADNARIREGQAKAADRLCPASNTYLDRDTAQLQGVAKIDCPTCGRPDTTVHGNGLIHAHQRWIAPVAEPEAIAS